MNRKDLMPGGMLVHREMQDWQWQQEIVAGLHEQREANHKYNDSKAATSMTLGGVLDSDGQEYEQQEEAQHE